MLRGYRLVIIAAFGWLILAAGPAPENTNDPKQAKSAQTIEHPLNSITSAHDQATNQSEANEYQAPCADGQYDNKSDLCAQWYAARAARDAADWALGALVVGLVGAVGIVTALWLTIDSNRIARSSARHQLRAYVGIESINLLENWRPEPPCVTGKTGGKHIRIVIKNFGATPANGVTTRFKPLLQAVSELRADPDIFDLKPEMQLTLQPGQSHTKIIDVDHRPSSPHQTLLRSEQFVMAVQGIIAYVDVWNAPQETKFFWTSSGEDYSVGGSARTTGGTTPPSPIIIAKKIDTL